MYKEFIIRLVQHFLSHFIFDAPYLNEIKRNILRIFFKIGNHSYIAFDTFLVSPHSRKNAFIKIGNNVAIEHRCDIDYSGGLIIRDNVWISEKVIIATHNHIITDYSLKKSQRIDFSTLVIENDAWIGAGAIILANVNRIGIGSIIGAGSVVTKDVEDWAVVASNPAKVLRFRE
jgi:acetyltransferase-like isoleucine patch superfamily enzyme